MFERYDHYQSLDPLQALRWLTRFAEADPAHARALGDISLKPSATPFGLRLDARVKHRRGRWRAQTRERLRQFFDDAPASARYTENVRVNDAGYLSVAQALPNLLHADEPPTDPAEHGYLGDEKLLVLRDPGLERGREAYAALRLHATQVHMALAQSSAGTFYLYHLLDDEARLSTFQGATSGGLFADALSLQTLAADVLRGESAYRVFVPDDWRPSRDVLALFVRLLLAAPELSGTPSADDLPRVNLAAILPDGLWLYLGATRFYEAWEMGRVTPFQRYQLAQVRADKRQLRQLRQRLDATAPEAGYRVRLRESHYDDEGETSLALAQREYQRIKRDITLLTDRLVELEALRLAHPRLLRFNRAQLGALVATLQRYRPQSLPHLRYAFHADDQEHPDGAHYLYIAPDATSQGLDPLLWQDLNAAQPIEFWLDPTWAAHYHRPPNEMLLFVPRGRRLYPPMHGWQPTQMDAHLRHWLPDIARWPDEPLLVIDGAQDDTLHVTLLNRGAFAPIDAPEVMRWLNDNLVLLREWPDHAEFVQALSETRRRQARYAAAENAAQSAHQRFDKAVHLVQDDYATYLDGLLQALEGEYGRIIEQAQTFVSHAQGLNQRLEQLVDLREGLSKRADDAEQDLKTTHRDLERFGKGVLDVERQVTQALKDAQRLGDKLDGDLKQQVDELQRRRRELENKIRELERLL